MRSSFQTIDQMTDGIWLHSNIIFRAFILWNSWHLLFNCVPLIMICRTHLNLVFSTSFFRAVSASVFKYFFSVMFGTLTNYP